MKKYTFIDLFAGCGGLSEGFLSSGKYRALAHIEWDPSISNILKENLITRWGHDRKTINNHVITFDLQKTDELLNGKWSKDSIDKYGKFNNEKVINDGLIKILKNKKVDIIIGGPPCQAYSIAGRAQDKNSMENDYRNYLFESYIEIIKHFKPKLFLLENVQGMLSAKPGNELVTTRIYKAFKKAGYNIYEDKKMKETLLNSSDFGVPQDRKRVILIGSRLKRIKLSSIYEDIKNTYASKKMTVKDAIGNYTSIIPKRGRPSKRISHQLTRKTYLKNHFPRYHNSRDIKIFKMWLIRNMNSKPYNKKIKFYKKYVGKDTNHNKYRNLEWNKPSKTIVAHLYRDGLLFIHPDPKQARTITTREAATLQSFDKNFILSGIMGTDFKAIGNAVPPLMAKKISEVLYNHLK